MSDCIYAILFLLKGLLLVYTYIRVDEAEMKREIFGERSAEDVNERRSEGAVGTFDRGTITVNS